MVQRKITSKEIQRKWSTHRVVKVWGSRNTRWSTRDGRLCGFSSGFSCCCTLEVREIQQGNMVQVTQEDQYYSGRVQWPCCYTTILHTAVGTQLTMMVAHCPMLCYRGCAGVASVTKVWGWGPKFEWTEDNGMVWIIRFGVYGGGIKLGLIEDFGAAPIITIRDGGTLRVWGCGHHSWTWTLRMVVEPPLSGFRIGPDIYFEWLWMMR